MNEVSVHTQAMTNAKTETSILSMNSETNEIITALESQITTQKQSTIQNTVIEIAIKFIKSIPIANGSIYDFDKDGIPEILEFQMGHDEGQIDYTVYKLKDHNYEKLGTIYANEISAGNKFTLYKDNESGELFYIGDHFSENKVSLYNGNDEINELFYKGIFGEGEFSTYKYIFKDDEITTTRIAYYHYTYTLDDLETRKFLIDSCYFLNDRPDLNTYQLFDNMNQIMGVDDYLSQFEKIEEPDLYPQWHRVDDNFENEIITVFEEFYKKLSNY